MDERQREDDPETVQRWEKRIREDVRDAWEYNWEHEVTEDMTPEDIIYYKKEALESARERDYEIAGGHSHEMTYADMHEIISGGTMLHRDLEDFDSGRQTGWNAIQNVLFNEALEFIRDEFLAIATEIEEEEEAIGFMDEEL